MPKSATATVYINIVRNQFRPDFTKEEYTAKITDVWAVGRDLFTATAVDNDRQVPLSQNTPNAEFDYIIDPDYVYDVIFFDINKDGVLYVKGDLQDSDGRNQFQVKFIL